MIAFMIISDCNHHFSFHCRICDEKTEEEIFLFVRLKNVCAIFVSTISMFVISCCSSDLTNVSGTKK
jgi:hypothetical protein